MKVGILLSGGKDSVYAAYLASQKYELSCAITIESENKESYMFHTPNISLTKLQTEAMEIPHLIVSTPGEKEKELKELKEALAEAKEKYSIEGIVTGAVASKYQADRIQQLCDELELFCYNPLWQIDQLELLKKLLENKFEVIISSIAAYGFNESWLGRTIDEKMIEDLKIVNKKTGIHIIFEGGEAETLVLDCPLFKKRLEVIEAEKIMTGEETGIFQIKEIKLVEK